MNLRARVYSLDFSSCTSLLDVADRLGSQGLIERNKCSHFDTAFSNLKSTGEVSWKITLPSSGLIKPDVPGYLACLIRQLCENGGTIDLVWPQDASKLAFYGGLRFQNLFTGEGVEDWATRVHLNIERSERKVAWNFVPLAWIDASSFTFQNQGEDFEAALRHIPELEQTTYYRLKSIFRRMGILDRGVAESIIDTFINEVGWNCVIHSAPSGSLGFGILGGQRLEGHLLGFELFVVDAGLGIPRTLCEAYYKSESREHEIRGESEVNGLLRWSLSELGTRRTIFPDAEYQRQKRGLFYVAKTISPMGSLQLSSERGRLKSKKICSSGQGQDAKWDFDAEELASSAPPGTFVSIKIPYDLKLSQITASMGPELALRRPKEKIFRVIECGAPHGEFDFQERESLVVDAYNCEGRPDFVASAVKILSSVENDFVYILGCPDVQNQAIVDDLVLLSDFPRTDSQSLILLDTNCSFALVTIQSGERSITIRTFDAKKELLLGKQSLFHELGFCGIHSKANSTHLEFGFEHIGESEGFYVGNILLFNSEQPVARYFSILKNLNRSERHARRWFVSLILKLFEFHVDQEIESSTVIGFSYPILGLIEQLVTQWDGVCRFVGVSSYGLDVDYEISTLLDKKDSVVLVTDVISTGSILTEAVDAIKATECILLGCICLVDAGGDGSKCTRTIDVPPSKISVESCSAIPSPIPATSVQPEYEVDPVSLIPVPRVVDERKGLNRPIEESIEFLIENYDLVRIGHILTGGRSTSIAVDFAELILRNADFFRHSLLSGIAALRGSRSEWMGFEAQVLIYPSTGRRVGKLSASWSEVPDHIAEIASHLPPDIRFCKVPRVFDSYGNSRCQASIQENLAIEAIEKGFDAVVFDDAIWSGNTGAKLIELAVSAGAKRVLFFSAVRRINESTWGLLENLNSVKSGEDIANVALICPLVLPVPLYSFGDSPYRKTIEKLQKFKTAPKIIADISDSIESELHPDNHYAEDIHHKKTWITCRCYAGASLIELRWLGHLEQLIDNSRHRLPEAAAVLRIFLQEWELLNKPGIRQRVRLKIFELCKHVVRELHTSDSVLADALSLLRSQFANSYVSIVSQLNLKDISKASVFKRIIFHLYSLPPSMKDDEYRIQIGRILEQLISFNSTADFSSVEKMECWGLLWLELFRRKLDLKTTPHAIAVALSKAVQSDGQLKHNYVIPLRSMTAESPDRIFQSPDFETCKKSFSPGGEAYNRLGESLSGLVLRFQNNLHISEGLYPDPMSGQLAYLTRKKGGYQDLTEFQDDLGRVAYILGSATISTKPPLPLLKVMKDACGRVIDAAVGDYSYLAEAMKDMHSRTPEMVVKEFCRIAESDCMMEGMNFEIEQAATEQWLAKKNLFIPSKLLTSILHAFSKNLVDHAFNGLDCGKVQIVVGELRETHISVSVYSDGLWKKGEETSIELGYNSEQLNNQLKAFGGEILAVSRPDSNWTAKQTAIIRFW